MKILLLLAAGVLVLGSGFLIGKQYQPPPINDGEIVAEGNVTNTAPVQTSTGASVQAPAKSTSGSVANANPSTLPKGLTNADLLKLADAKYTSGEVPLGDYKYVTTGPKKGYVYLCSAQKDTSGGGSMVNGPWIHGQMWNVIQKIAIAGSVSWPAASFTDLVSGALRTLTTNGLPVSHTTGTFPVAQSDPAKVYDANPNTITKQEISVSLPVKPVYSATPYCMGGEVGIMTTGVPLFNAFDATLRDAAAHEVQDSCNGHPQKEGEYHYHTLSACIKNLGVTKVIGYAYDGYPITGPEVEPGKYLSTEDLDVCHGIVSDVMLDGQMTTTYHYVMTQDFPYSVSCFRAKPVTKAPSAKPISSPPMPPQGAIDSCAGKGAGGVCSFSSPQGTVAGTCKTTPSGSFACVP